MQTNQTNVERLAAAGILNPDLFSEQDRKTIETITPEEIDVLIGLGKKLGPTPPGREFTRPNFPV